MYNPQHTVVLDRDTIVHEFDPFELDSLGHELSTIASASPRMVMYEQSMGWLCMFELSHRIFLNNFLLTTV